jgi:hypothetical protein
MRKKRTLVSIAVTFLDRVSGGNPQAMDTPEARAACTGDALKLCLSEIRSSKGIDQAKERVGACLRKNRQQASAACQKFLPEE